MPAHRSKDKWRGEQQHDRECRRQSKRENKSVQRKRVGDIALAGAERAGNCRGNAAAHAARRRVLHQHHKREGERYSRQRIRTETARNSPSKVTCRQWREG
jgi:hypothetical protein